MTAFRRAWMHRAAAAAVAWLAVLLAVASCGLRLPGAASSQGSAAPPVDRIHGQAQAALDRWAEAVRDSGGASISFVGEMTSQIGDWEASVGDNNKAALMAGLVAAAAELSDERPSRKEVRWLDGTKIEVNVLSAADALADLVAAANGGPCPECRPLLVSDANLATGLVETSTGPAEAPVWVYTIKGTQVRVTRIAVDKAVTVEPPPWNANDPPEGISIDSAIGTEASRRLGVSFIGAVERSNKPCGADYTAEAVESDLAVVVIIYAHRNMAAGACTLVGKTRTAEVELAAPLGERAVLEVKQGLPVPLRAP